MALEGMRDLLRSALRRSLEKMPDEDRIAMAWPIACGKALSGHGEVAGFSEGIILIEVADGPWAGQLRSMQSQLAAEVGRIAGVRVRGIDFRVMGKSKGREWKKQ